MELAVHAGFVPRHLLIEPRVFQRNRQLCRQNRQRLDVLLGEVVQLGALQVEHAHHAILVDHRNGKFRTRFRIHHGVARVRSDVRHQHRLAQSRRSTHDALARGASQPALNSLTVFHVEALPKHLLLVVVQQDAQNLIVNDALNQFGSAAQQLFDVQDGAGLAANLIEHS